MTSLWNISEPTLKDAIFLWFNLIPLGISAGLRAVFWTLRIPFAFWTWKWAAAHWEDDFLMSLPLTATGICGQSIEHSKIDEIKKELLSRAAHRFPHAGGRHFTKHIEGRPVSVLFSYSTVDLLLQVSQSF